MPAMPHMQFSSHAHPEFTLFPETRRLQVCCRDHGKAFVCSPRLLPPQPAGPPSADLKPSENLFIELFGEAIVSVRALLSRSRLPNPSHFPFAFRAISS